jgi:hypothetical protein
MQRGALPDLDTFLLVAEHWRLPRLLSATRYGSLRRDSV